MGNAHKLCHCVPSNVAAFKGDGLQPTCTSTKVVRSVCLRLHGLLDGLHRHAQHGSRPQQLPGSRRGQVVLAHVQTCSARRQGDVDAVVDDDWDAGRTAHSHDLPDLPMTAPQELKIMCSGQSSCQVVDKVIQM